MSMGEMLYLALVLAAFRGFALLIAVLMWSDGKYEKQLAAAKAAGSSRLRVVASQPAMAHAPYEEHGCDAARLLGASEVSLPIHPYMTEEEVEHVIETCNRWRA